MSMVSELECFRDGRKRLEWVHRRIEVRFTDAFEGGDRRRAMRTLRTPDQVRAAPARHPVPTLRCGGTGKQFVAVDWGVLKSGALLGVAASSVALMIIFAGAS